MKCLVSAWIVLASASAVAPRKSRGHLGGYPTSEEIAVDVGRSIASS